MYHGIKLPKKENPLYSVNAFDEDSEESESSESDEEKRRNNHIVLASKKMTKTTEMKRDPLSKEKRQKQNWVNRYKSNNKFILNTKLH